SLTSLVFPSFPTRRSSDLLVKLTALLVIIPSEIQPFYSATLDNLDLFPAYMCASNRYSRYSRHPPRHSINFSLAYYRCPLRLIYAVNQPINRRPHIRIEKVLASSAPIFNVRQPASVVPRNRRKSPVPFVIAYAIERLNFRRYSS